MLNWFTGWRHDGERVARQRVGGWRVTGWRNAWVGDLLTRESLAGDGSKILPGTVGISTAGHLAGRLLREVNYQHHQPQPGLRNLLVQDIPLDFNDTF